MTETAAKQKAGDAQEQGEGSQLALQKHRWVPVKLIDRRALSKDTRTYTFELPPGKPELGIGTCQHLQVGFHLQDKMLVRPYTPTRPVMPTPPASPPGEASSSANAPEQQRENTKEKEPHSQNRPPTPPESPPHSGSDDPQHDASKPKTFDLTVKTYFPTPEQPGGALSNLLDCMPLGEEVEIRGPTGDIVYLGNSDFQISNPFSPGKPRKLHFPRVSLVLGGSGITPGYALMARIVQEAGNETQVRAVDANKSEEDILLKEDLDRFEKESEGRVKTVHVLSRAGEGWKGEKGRVDGDLLKRVLFPPEKGSVVFLCGPPGLVQKAALPALKGMAAPVVLLCG